MKVHTDVDDTLDLIHQIDATAANVHDIVTPGQLLHGKQQRVFGDWRSEHKHRKNVFWFIAKRRGTRKMQDANKLKTEKIRASLRSKA